MKQDSEALRKKAIAAAVAYYESVPEGEPFSPGQPINYAGRVYDHDEIACLVDASLDFWLTSGRYATEFEKSLSEYLNVKYVSLVNSGSSANLLAFMALTSPKLKERRIQKGDEVITVAAAFPTTVAPIIQYGAIPVFVDVCLPGLDIDCSLLESARSPKTKAVMLAHTLGNPFDLGRVKAFCDKYNLWLIEDNCDALGSEFEIDGSMVKTGSVGDIGTSSFYPPHHITMGEGGAVYTNDKLLQRIVNSFRDWGRDCWCAPGVDNSCQNRFRGQFGELPEGFDHKYVYSHFGYNLKVTDMQAAIGCAQLRKLPEFVKKRRQNFQYFRENLESVNDVLMLPEPMAGSIPSWFGFPLTIKKAAPFSRAELVERLEKNGIQTRVLFAGNLIKHPCFDEMRASGEGYRVAGSLDVTDQVMHNTFWFGVYPGLTVEMREYIVKTIVDFVSGL